MGWDGMGWDAIGCQRIGKETQHGISWLSTVQPGIVEKASPPQARPS